MTDPCRLGHSSVLLVHDEIDDLAGFPLLQGERDYLDEIARLETSRKRYLAQTKALTAQNDLLKSARDQIPSKPVSTARSFSRKALGEAQYTKSLVCLPSSLDHFALTDSPRIRRFSQASTTDSTQQLPPSKATPKLHHHSLLSD